MSLTAPFPWFGGKARIASVVWRYLGDDVNNYVEPFFGSGAVLLARPAPWVGIETVNDLDGFVCNFWRAVSRDASIVAKTADLPLSEIDVYSIHKWLLDRRDEMFARLVHDPDYFDASIAGRWAWRISAERLANWHKGTCYMPSGFHYGQGVIALRHHGRLEETIQQLSIRLRLVRVFCSDWQRVLDHHVCSSTFHPVGIFLDPPYSKALRSDDLYAEDAADLAADVKRWAVSHGDDERLRIALCGYAGEHDMPNDWKYVRWETQGGYANLGKGKGRGKDNARSEVVWFSRGCRVVPCQGTFDLGADV